MGPGPASGPAMCTLLEGQGAAGKKLGSGGRRAAVDKRTANQGSHQSVITFSHRQPQHHSRVFIMYVWLQRIQELQFPSLGAHCDSDFFSRICSCSPRVYTVYTIYTNYSSIKTHLQN